MLLFIIDFLFSAGVAHFVRRVDARPVDVLAETLARILAQALLTLTKCRYRPTWNAISINAPYIINELRNPKRG